ncbi:toxic anion resistance protein [Brevundimonas sp.]|uniref:toxic anion resistance protein n=1 Tax=Brevundimonas sp. TaxID=1871086 RepID=UPI002D4109B7|nr:toxic anion resistance protein [Brevundimonas sp.]HYC67703.1 toxic anion resistance protein [Brevundimonas sp.]
MADGAYRWQGHAPTPDAARVDAIHAGYDEAEAHAFAEPARAAAVARLDQVLAALREADTAGAGDPLNRARTGLASLNPAVLEPRRGLAALFDSRKRRLRDFRDAFRRAAASLSDVAGELTGHVEASARRSADLDAVWSDLRDAMVELDAHRLAAARRLSDHQPAADAPPHPLEARQAALDACRAAALGALPLIRNAQNADARAAEALRACSDGAAAWSRDWSEALGRPKKVRPDRERLLRLRDDLLARIDRASAELTASRARRAGVGERLSELRAPL